MLWSVIAACGFLAAGAGLRAAFEEGASARDSAHATAAGKAESAQSTAKPGKEGNASVKPGQGSESREKDKSKRSEKKDNGETKGEKKSEASDQGKTRSKETDASCDEEKRRTSKAALTEAVQAAEDGDLREAAKKYEEALSSCDEGDRRAAEAQYVAVRTRMRSAWWQLPLAPWFYQHRAPFRWFWNQRLSISWRATRERVFGLKFTEVVTWLPVVTLLVLLALALSPKVLDGHGLIWWMGRVPRWIVRPPFRGRAHIVTPTKLGKEGEPELFADTLRFAAIDVRDRVLGAGDGQSAGPIELLTVPSALLQQVVDSLPDVKDVAVTKWLQFLRVLLRYASWHVESTVSYVATEEIGGAGRMRVSASLHWASYTAGIWEREVLARSATDVDSAAQAIAARLVWKGRKG